MDSSLDMKIGIAITLIILHSKGATTESTRKILAGTDVTLDCPFNKPDHIPLMEVTVEWGITVDQQTIQRLVYTFQNQRPKVHRDGFWVDTKGLLQGNASLHLFNVTVADEGVYCCRVIITPNTYKVSTQLEVSARPVISLPETATVMQGEKKTLMCDITGFYPEQLTVTWLIQNGSRLSRGVCTGMAAPNPDGTYSVSSLLTVQAPTAGSRGVVYVCHVTHRSPPGNHSKGVLLNVQAPVGPGFDVVTLMAVTSVVSVFLVFSVIGGVLVLYRYIHTVPPTVSNIIKPTIIHAMKPTALKCTIKCARRFSELRVKWFRISANGEFAAASDSQSKALLSPEDLSDQADMHSEGQQHVSSLNICVSVKEDMSKYQCVVLYRGTKITRETTVSVKVNPTFLQISSIPQIPKLERPLMLCCRVEKFYPDKVDVEWSRNDGEPVGSITNYGPFSDHESMYSMWSKIELVMAEEDKRAVYTCRVYHSSFPLTGYRDVLYHINTQGTPPSVMFIKCEPPGPWLSEQCTLNLCVKDFCPEQVSVTWFRDGKVIPAGQVFNSPPSLNINGLYSMWTFLKVTPTPEDSSSEFRCRVEHSAQTKSEERVFTLSDIKAR